ncbi:polysaccharide pyruvyl transferase family protein [Stenotrophomonas maltophilia]|uniref:polysaccharide pyruvyl transferase family protein n=1 Tax=Stenotrophomonas maltophilia TaxID=40324 RepID=UPI003BF7BF35
MTQRIGLLTLPLHSNYGGIIQIAALSAFVRALGLQPVLLRKEHQKAGWKRMVIEVLKRLPGQNIANYRNQYLKLQRHAAFMEAFLPEQSRVSRSPAELRMECDRLGLDAVVVGSDQVWRLDYIDDGAYDAYFLSFLVGSPIRRVSYAASFGTDRWPDASRVEDVSRLLAGFQAVSVREDSGQELCADRFGRSDAVHVLDPTLLVDRSFHEEVIATLAPGRGEGGLYAYVLDRSAAKKAIIDAAGQSENLSKITIAEPENDLEGYVDLGEWVRRFRDAEFVVTDSYHGMIFSIIFEKQFVAIGNAGRGLTRFKSLLAQLGLEDRLVEVGNERVQLPGAQIDYSRVNRRIAELRMKSRAFLSDALDVEARS